MTEMLVSSLGGSVLDSPLRQRDGETLAMCGSSARSASVDPMALFAAALGYSNTIRLLGS